LGSVKGRECFFEEVACRNAKETEVISQSAEPSLPQGSVVQLRNLQRLRSAVSPRVACRRESQANGVPHMYEPALRCGNHTLFPDFVADTVVGRVIIEVSGFRAPHTWVRLSEKLKLYLSQRVADRILVVHLERDRETAQKVAKELGSLVSMISLNDMKRLLHSVASSKDPLGNVRIISLGQAMQACRRINGKRFHLYQLIRSVPKAQWATILIRCGLPTGGIEKVRKVSGLKKRLIEATRLADSQRFILREAMVEMIAGAYQSAVCYHFGSMNNLALASEDRVGKKLS
jgi:hypothetical protein